jgi:hypothetical protein
MGLFSHIGDVVSGKNYKRNVLLVDNLNFIAERVEGFKGKTRTRVARPWSDACALAAYAFLDYILFGEVRGEQERELVAPLRKNLDRVNKRSAYDMFKILVCYQLACVSDYSEFRKFLSKSESRTGPVEIDQLWENLKKDIFQIWGFTEEDKNLYGEFEAYVTEAVLYIQKVYREFVAKGYGFEPEHTVFTAGVFGHLLVEGFSRTFNSAFTNQARRHGLTT